MFCPECGTPLDEGVCPRCGVTYELVPHHAQRFQKKKCPRCAGDVIFVSEKTAGLLLLPVGIKSKKYKCRSCGYELSETDFRSMHTDKEFQKARKDLKNEMKNKIKKFVKKV